MTPSGLIGLHCGELFAIVVVKEDIAPANSWPAHCEAGHNEMHFVHQFVGERKTEIQKARDMGHRERKRYKLKEV